MPSKAETVSVGSDMNSPVVDFVVKDLRERGYSVDTFIPSGDIPLPWPEVGEQVGQAISAGHSRQGVLFCWTGTGVCMAANKVPGVRAALCCDAQTATGARRWNDANILVMSLRVTSEALAAEILEAWFSASLDSEDDARHVAELDEIDRKHRTPAAPVVPQRNQR